MLAGKDPYRARDLTALIAPDRRRQHAAMLVIGSMIAGAVLVLFAERVVESLNEPPPPLRTPHVVEHDRIAGDPTMRHRDFIQLIDLRVYDPGAHM